MFVYGNRNAILSSDLTISRVENSETHKLKDTIYSSIKLLCLGAVDYYVFSLWCWSKFDNLVDVS